MTPRIAAHAPLLAFLDAQPSLSPFAGLALRAAVQLETWSKRRRTRLALQQLDDRLLNDVGLNRREAYLEARRKFWQG